jgi:lipopolysaccharide biosynthesis glycosyltransferase
MRNQVINICYAADENYAMQAGVSICSVLENNADDKFQFFILCDRYSEDSKEKFAQIEQKYNTKIDLINVTAYLETLSKTALYVPDAIGENGLITFMYARLFIASLLPGDVERLLYIDCDTFVNADLASLASYPLKKTMGAVIDLYPVEYNRRIAFKQEDLYFNSGVLLIDLNRWRALDIENKIMQNITNLTETYYMHDQDILNVVLKEEIEAIPLDYNMMYISRAYSAEDVLRFTGKTEATYYSLDAIRQAQKHMVIIHYAGDYYGKPWNFPTSNPYASLWNNMKARSPWKNVPLEKQPVKKKINQRLHEVAAPVIKEYWLKRTHDRFLSEIENG